MRTKYISIGIVLAGLLAPGAGLIARPEPARAETTAGDSQQALRRYRVGITGMT